MAGGLSAAVILLWWPRFFPADNATTWLVRGVVWTLSFELLVHALLPIERALWDTRAGERFRAAGDRLGSPRRSVRGRAGVACAALSVPVALLVAAPPQAPQAKPTTPVRHVTEVKRIVKVERRQVRVAQVLPVAATSPQPAESSSSPAPVAIHSKPVTRSTIGAHQSTPPRKSTQTTGNSSSGTQSPTSTQAPASTPEQVAAAPVSTGR